MAAALAAWWARLKAALPRAIAAALAATIAYATARWLLGHPMPVFTAVGAIICLAPGIASHVRQSVNVLMGVTLGILIGEAVLFVPGPAWEFRVGVAVFLSLAVGASFGLPPVFAIQAGVSAVLIQLMGPETAGLNRLLDVAIGLAVSLPFGAALYLTRKTDEGA